MVRLPIANSSAIVITNMARRASRTPSSNKGFTIVELLIVIVVIAILAAITVVAYNGIQNSANDAAVKSDMRNYANQMLQFHAKNGRYAAGNNNNAPEGITSLKLSKGSYDTSVNNAYYCANTTKFAVAARSKSGAVWAYHSDSGLQAYSGPWTVSTDICPQLGVNSYTFSNAHGQTGGWYPWAQ